MTCEPGEIAAMNPAFLISQHHAPSSLHPGRQFANVRSHE